MKKGTQARLADWTLTIGCASMLLPFIALISIFGVGSGSTFWLSCSGIAIFAISTFWLIWKMGKGEIKMKEPVWILSIIYFSTVIFAISIAFNSIEVALALGIAEGIGLLLSVIGLVHEITTKNKPNQSVQATSASRRV